MSQLYGIAVVFEPSVPLMRSAKYLRFIRSMACCVCGSWKLVEAAHTGPHGLSEKASDRDTIPLCAKHHRTDTFSLSALGPVIFSELYGVNIPVLVEKFNGLYDQRIVRKRRS